MENNQELFKQAILDAKAVRETAMAAARTTLAEHFEPYIKQTMQETLSEDMDKEMEESKMDDEELKENHLDAILRELDELAEDMDGEEVNMEEGHIKSDGYDGKKGRGQSGYDEKAKVSRGGTGYPEKAKSSIHEAEEDDADEDFDDNAEKAGEDVTKDMEAGGDEAMGGDAQEVVDITVGELKDIIRDVFTQLQGGGEDLGADQGAFDADTEMAADMGGEEGEDDSKEISLEEILAELEEEEKRVEEAAHVPGSEIDPKAGDVYAVEKELKEAVKTIKALRTELNEVNLFSAKMLYVNKLFKSKNLTESQKTKVVNAFDRATSVKEVENTYKTLLESVGETKKSTIRESVGFASKPIGNAPARPIVEVDAFVTRWQQLAGIK